MRKIRIAQIGINQFSHGLEIFNTLKKLTDVFEIAGYVLVEDEREKCASKLNVFDGYKELTLEEVLSDESIEAVTVETDEIHLLKYALLAVKSGKHVHMEKPGSQSLPAFRELMDAVKASDKAFTIGYMYRYNPYVIDIINRVKSGELGKVLSVDAEMSCRHGVPLRTWLSTFNGGMTFYLGCHLIDLVLQIQGIPERILPLNKSSGIDGLLSEDIGMAVLEYKNGVSTVKTSAAERGGFLRRRLCVVCENATVEIQPLEVVNVDKPYGITTYKREEDTDTWFDAPKSFVSDEYDRYEDMIKTFASVVRGEIENPYSVEYELELFTAVLKCCGADTEI